MKIVNCVIMACMSLCAACEAEHRSRDDNAIASGALNGVYPYGTPVGTTLPTLTVSFVGPDAHSIGFGQNTDFLCWSLLAQGGDLGVTLPPIQFMTADGQVVTTNPDQLGYAFGAPAIYDGTTPVIAYPGGSTFNPVTGFDIFRSTPIALTAGQPRNLCLQSGFSNPTTALRQAFNRAYRFSMDAWGPNSALVPATGQYLPVSQITAPPQMMGNLITLVYTPSGNVVGVPPGAPAYGGYGDTYGSYGNGYGNVSSAGAPVYVQPGSNYGYGGYGYGSVPPGQAIALPEAPVSVVGARDLVASVLVLDVMADDDNACLIRMDVERAGPGIAEDGLPPELYAMDQGRTLLARGTPFTNGESIIGPNSSGTLFCLADGAPRRLAVVAYGPQQYVLHIERVDAFGMKLQAEAMTSAP